MFARRCSQCSKREKWTGEMFTMFKIMLKFILLINVHIFTFNYRSQCSKRERWTGEMFAMFIIFFSSHFCFQLMFTIILLIIAMFTFLFLINVHNAQNGKDGQVRCLQCSQFFGKMFTNNEKTNIWNKKQMAQQILLKTKVHGWDGSFWTNCSFLFLHIWIVKFLTFLLKVYGWTWSLWTFSGLPVPWPRP